MRASHGVSFIGKGILRTESQSVASLLIQFDRVILRSNVVQTFDSRALCKHERLSCGLNDKLEWVGPLIKSSEEVIVEEKERDFEEWSQLENYISELHSEPMEEIGHVLWKIHLFSFRGKSVLFFRWHHIIGDGAALGQVWASMADNFNFDAEVPRVTWSQWFRLWAWILGLWWIVVLRWFYMFLAYPKQAAPFQPQAPPTPSTTLVKKQRLALSQSAVVEMDSFHVKRHGGGGGTVNDIILTAVNRAIASLTGEYDKSLAMGMAVNIRFRRDDTPVLRNLIGSMSLFLPCVNPHKEPFDKTLLAVSAATQSIKRLPEAYVAATTLILSNFFPVSWAQWLFRTMSSRVRLLVSNVVGSTKPLELFGGTAKSMMGFVPPPYSTPCAIGVLSYGGGLYLSVACNAAGFSMEPRVILDACERELKSYLK